MRQVMREYICLILPKERTSSLQVSFKNILRLCFFQRFRKRWDRMGKIRRKLTKRQATNGIRMSIIRGPAVKVKDILGHWNGSKKLFHADKRFLVGPCKFWRFYLL